MYHGPSTPGTFGAILMILISVLLIVFALQRGTRLGAPFSHGKGPSVPIGSAGRVITFLIAVVLLVEALRALFR